MEIIFLTVEDVIYVQSEILSNAPIADIGKLESAIKRAEQYHFYEKIVTVHSTTSSRAKRWIS